MRRLVLFTVLASGCATPYCGDGVRVGPDASPLSPYCTGDTLQIEGAPGSYGLSLGFEVEGIDGSGGATVVVRLTPDGQSSQDALGSLPMFLDEGGVWTSNTFFSLREQTEEEVTALDGVSASLSAAFTADATVEVVINDLVLSAP